MLQAACFLAVRYLDLVLLQQAEYPPPPQYLNWDVWIVDF